MSSTRPIPITSNRSRASPPTSSSRTTNSSPPSALDLGISQSCPVPHAPNGHLPIPLHTNTTNATAMGTSSTSNRFQLPPPPRAPFFGSLPEPSFLQIDDNPMPELVLPPPVHHSRNNSPAPPSVVQFASSCPVDSFMRPAQHSWTPSPRPFNELDLSKSPALAFMSAAREGRAPAHRFRRVGQPTTTTSRHRSNSASRRLSGADASTDAMLAQLSITEEEQSNFSDDSSADFTLDQSFDERLEPAAAMRRLLLLARDDDNGSSSDRGGGGERRESYGSLSDTGGDAGVFDFEES